MDKVAYTLIKDEEQVKLERIRDGLTCLCAHLSIGKDARGHIWPLVSCQGCYQSDFCRRLKLIVEEGMN